MKSTAHAGLGSIFSSALVFCLGSALGLAAGCSDDAPAPDATTDDGTTDGGTVRLAQGVIELYAEVQIGDRKELEVITRLVSIDNVKGNIVRVYATQQQLDSLVARGYQFNILPHPGFNPSPRMGAIMRDGKGVAWDRFPTWGEYVQLMNDWARAHPDICRLVDIGPTTNSKRPHRLLALKITDNPDLEEDEPEVLYTATMHGDETVGYMLMMHLIEELLTGYGNDAEITAMVSDMEIWINPLANPDGTFYQGDDTVSGAVREYVNASGNYAGIDPNRNFPELDARPSPANLWLETQLMVEFAAAHSFTLSANFHGGAEVMNYPWDSLRRLHADDKWLAGISRTYADLAQADGPAGYFTDEDNGITNGYGWYPVYGGRQDFMTYFHGDREITIEVSGIKNPPGSQIPTFWKANRRALYTYLRYALTGVRGVVTNAKGEPVRARVDVVGHDIDADRSFVLTDPEVGDYHRMLLPGTYKLRFAAPGYLAKSVSNVVVGEGVATRIDVLLDEEGTGLTVSGTVKSADTLAPVAGAKVEIIGTSTVATTTESGAFSIGPVAAGVQTFRVSAVGFATMVAEREVLPESASLDFALAAVSATGFSSAFESDDGGLLASGTPSLPGFMWGELVGANPTAHSGSRVWAAPLADDYADDAEWLLELRDVNIGAGRWLLTFWHWYSLELGYAAYDGAHVQVAVTGDPQGYVAIVPEGGYPQSAVSALGEAGYSGESMEWVQATFDLSAYAGKTVSIRWRMATDGSQTERGWAIDDVNVGPAPAP